MSLNRSLPTSRLDSEGLANLTSLTQKTILTVPPVAG